MDSIPITREPVRVEYVHDYAGVVLAEVRLTGQGPGKLLLEMISRFHYGPGATEYEERVILSKEIEMPVEHGTAVLDLLSDGKCGPLVWPDEPTVFRLSSQDDGAVSIDGFLNGEEFVPYLEVTHVNADTVVVGDSLVLSPGDVNGDGQVTVPDHRVGFVYRLAEYEPRLGVIGFAGWGGATVFELAPLIRQATDAGGSRLIMQGGNKDLRLWGPGGTYLVDPITFTDEMEKHIRYAAENRLARVLIVTPTQGINNPERGFVNDSVLFFRDLYMEQTVAWVDPQTNETHNIPGLVHRFSRNTVRGVDVASITGPWTVQVGCYLHWNVQGHAQAAQAIIDAIPEEWLSGSPEVHVLYLPHVSK